MNNKLILNFFKARKIEFCFALSIISMLFTSLVWVKDTNNTLIRKQNNNLTLKESLSLKRNYFLGHQEMSDIIDGLSVIAASVDMFSNQSPVELKDSKIRLRFNESLNTVKFLSRFTIGMTDVYILPAMYLTFEDNDPVRSMEIIELGMQDKRSEYTIFLLGAFLSHVFMRDTKKAGEYYEYLYTHFKGPAWTHELAQKMLNGEDPYDTMPNVKKYIDNSMMNAFPRAKAIFEKNEKKRLQKLQETKP